MSKLNLEKLIPGVLWVDRDQWMFIVWCPDEYKHPRFFAIALQLEPKPFKAFEDAREYLEKLLGPKLEEQDQEWIDAAYSCVATSYNDGQKVGRREGIHHERERVSSLLSDEYLFECYSRGRDGVRAIRKHLGLDPE